MCPGLVAGEHAQATAPGNRRQDAHVRAGAHHGGHKAVEHLIGVRRRCQLDLVDEDRFYGTARRCPSHRLPVAQEEHQRTIQSRAHTRKWVEDVRD